MDAEDAYGGALLVGDVQSPFRSTPELAIRVLQHLAGMNHCGRAGLLRPFQADAVVGVGVGTALYIGNNSVMLGSEIRWIAARGQGDDADIINRVMYGVFIDVTGRKQAEESHELLAGEMSHRVKNLLAIASGLTEITSRGSASTVDMAPELTQRLASLGRAHDLIRPLPGQDGRAALLGDLLTILLAPYDDLGAFSGRIRVSVPRMGVGEVTATTLALVLHELAINSLKYGALSAATGTLDVSAPPPEEDAVIVWTERGGPPVTAPAGAGGFGSKLVVRSLAQIGGSIDCSWQTEGVVITMRIKAERLAT